MDELQKQFNAVRTEISTLRAKLAGGPLEGEDSHRMAELITTGNTLKAQIEQQVEAGKLDDWATRSTGMPRLAGGTVDFQGFSEAGTTTIGKSTPEGAYRIADQYGEGIYDPNISAQIATKEYGAAFRQYLRARGGQIRENAIRTLQEGQDAEGGYLVPEDILNRIIAREPTPTRVQGRVMQLNTSRDSLTIPKVNYTADDIYTTGMRVTWTGEVPASSTAMRVTDPVFGQEKIPVYTAMMSIPITNDMLEDSAFDLLGYVSGKFGETIDILKDNMILNGTGTGQPTGILRNPGTANQPAVITTAASGALDAPSIIKMAMSLPEQYEDNAAWVFNKTSTAAAIAALVDSQNRPMWGVGLQDAGLEAGYKNRMLVGSPVVLSGLMPNVAASAYPALYGDLKSYYLVNRIGLSVQVLRELYAETNQILVLGRIRFGGKLVEPWRMKIMKIHA